VAEEEQQRNERTRAGLCFTCRHAQRVISSRGSDFWLCLEAAVDPSLSRYPQLPVIRCGGYEADPQSER
jgi:hypothetical protein